MSFESYLKDNDVFIFDLDQVLYPEKDFLLQVYYLFAQFIEYSEQKQATEILRFMQEVYAKDGHEGIFEKTASKFGISAEFKLNFDLLQRNVRLPLKLLIFEECMRFLQAIVVERKQIFLLVSGNPEAQLNKIKQMEWQGLETYLTVYFSEEIELDKNDGGLSYLIEKHELEGKKILAIIKNADNLQNASNVGVNFLQVERLFLP